MKSNTLVYIPIIQPQPMLDILPSHLSERIRVVGEKSQIKDSGPVVVWLKSSHRFHENPAIDTGRIGLRKQPTAFGVPWNR